MSLASGALVGPGVTLPPPVALYPTGVVNVANLPSNNILSLAPGEAVVLPRGTFIVTPGAYCDVQWLDPVTTIWRNISSARIPTSLTVVSDGQNFRVGNFTSCPVAAIVTNGGTSGYAQSTTTITASSGNSSWQPIVGGQLGSTVTITSAGSGYGLPPLVYVPAPPAPGIPASFIASITNGTISGVTCLNQGAGYTGSQTLVMMPNPADPNLLAGTTPTAGSATATIVTASGTASSGKLTGVLCLNPGASLTTAPTLTVTGASTGAAVSAMMLWTVTGMTITASGTVVSSNLVTSVGGVPTVTAAWTNPELEPTGYIPRQVQAQAAVASGTLTLGNTLSSLYDGGLFLGSTPTPIIIPTPTGTPTVSFLVGGVNTTVQIQPVG